MTIWRRRPWSLPSQEYYKNPLINISEIYDEIYTVPEFIETYNPVMKERSQPIYVKLNNLNPLLFKTDIMSKLQEASDLAGGTGIGTKHTQSLSDMMISVGPALLFVAFIILSGYFLIYNIFYISTSSDIRWFGMMKTIGTTAKQLKYILMCQIRRLALIGIVFGILLGYLVGNKIGPRIMEQTMYGMFYEAPSILAVGILGAGFAWLTVYISALKSLKLACNISPVEAARFAPKKKKNLFTILSFALSGMIFLVSCNAMLGYSVDNMVERYNMNDARIFHSGAWWWLEEAYQPISSDLPKEIEELPFVTDVEVMYRARTMPDYEEDAWGRQYTDSSAEVSLGGALKEEMETCAGSEAFLNTYGDHGISEQAANNRWKMRILGVSRRDDRAGDGVQPGDQVSIGFYDGAGNCVEKELTVLAVIEKENMYSTNDFGTSNIILSDTLFKELYPDYEQRISNIEIWTEKEITKEQHQQLNTLMGKEHSTQLNLDSRYDTREQMNGQKETFLFIGFFLAALLGIIGISNLINTIASDVFSRKIELASMQSIGMTKKQLWAMLLIDTVKFTSVAVLLMLIVGGVLSYLITQSSLFTGF